MDISHWNWINWIVFAICILFGMVLLSLVVFVFWHVKNPNEKMMDRIKSIKDKHKVRKQKRIKVKTKRGKKHA